MYSISIILKQPLSHLSCSALWLPRNRGHHWEFPPSPNVVVPVLIAQHGNASSHPGLPDGMMVEGGDTSFNHVLEELLKQVLVNVGREETVDFVRVPLLSGFALLSCCALVVFPKLLAFAGSWRGLKTTFSKQGVCTHACIDARTCNPVILVTRHHTENPRAPGCPHL